MPLNTSVTRKGRRRKISWGMFHVAAMTLAAAIDSKEGKLYELLAEKEPGMLGKDEITLGPGDVGSMVGYHVIAATPLNSRDYTMQGTLTFIDATDGERFTLEPGDVLSAWRQ